MGDPGEGKAFFPPKAYSYEGERLGGIKKGSEV